MVGWEGVGWIWIGLRGVTGMGGLLLVFLNDAQIGVFCFTSRQLRFGRHCRAIYGCQLAVWSVYLAFGSFVRSRHLRAGKAASNSFACDIVVRVEKRRHAEVWVLFAS